MQSVTSLHNCIDLVITVDLGPSSSEYKQKLSLFPSTLIIKLVKLLYQYFVSGGFITFSELSNLRLIRIACFKLVLVASYSETPFIENATSLAERSAKDTHSVTATTITLAVHAH